MPENSKIFGVSTLIFRELPLEKALLKIASAGFTQIDLSIVPPTFCPHYLPLDTSKEDDLKLKDLVEENNLKVVTLNVVPGYYNYGDPETVNKFLKRCVDIAGILGAESITMPTGVKVAADVWEENAKNVKKHLLEIGKYSVDRGVFISIETPHAKTLTETLDESKRFHEILNTDIIKATFDTSHVIRGEKNSIVDGIGVLGFDKINHIHLRDTIGENISFTPGKGHGDFLDFFKFVKNSPYKGHFMFELEYHNYPESKILEELKFAENYCTNLYFNESLPFNLKLKSNNFVQFTERMKNNPKLELRRFKRLFSVLQAGKKVVVKFMPTDVYTGKWEKKFRSTKPKVYSVEPGSCVIQKDSGKKFRVGVVGLGWAGSMMHAPGFQRLNNTEIIGGFDIDKSKTESFASKFNCAAYSNIEDLVKSGKPDLVAICSREWAHYEPAMYLLNNGVDVFCEKIMATKYDHGKEMVDTAKRNGRILAVNYNYRFMPAIKKLKEIIETKALGKLAYFNINVHGKSYAHALDLLHYLGGKITSVSGVYHNDDKLREFGGTDWSLYDDDILYVPSINTSVTCEFESGSVGIVNSSYYYALGAFILSIDAVFENGAVTVNGINMLDTIGNLTYFGKEKITKVDLDFKKGVYTKGWEYNFWSSIESFMRSYTGDRKFETSGEIGLFNIMLEKAIARSNNENIKVIL